jgi:uncharacterized membrane protein
MRTKRRRFLAFLINQVVQRHFIIMQFLVLVGMMLFLVYAAFLSQDQVSLALSAEVSDLDQLKVDLRALYRSLLVTLISIFAIGYVINVILGLLFLHRAAGPMVRVRHILESLSEGDYPEGPVRFRRGDYSQEISVSIDHLVNYLKRKLPVKKAS